METESSSHHIDSKISRENMAENMADQPDMAMDPNDYYNLIMAFDEVEKSMSKIKSQDKKDGKGKHFKIHYGYENPDLFPKDHEWTIWITGLVSVTFMICWFFKIKFGNDEINGEMRFLLKEDMG